MYMATILLVEHLNATQFSSQWQYYLLYTYTCIAVATNQTLHEFYASSRSAILHVFSYTSCLGNEYTCTDRFCFTPQSGVQTGSEPVFWAI